jgi:hypothetical protein
MKYLFLLLTTAFVFLGLAISAQHPSVLPKSMIAVNEFPDSVRVELPDQQAIILFELKNVKQKATDIERFSERVKAIQAYITSSLSDVSNPHHVLITENENLELEITITQNEHQKTQLRIKDQEIQELLPPGWEMIWKTKESIIHLYLHDINELDAVSRVDYANMASNLKSEAQQSFVGRKRMIAHTIIKNNETAFRDVKFQMPSDFLGIHFGTGFGFLQNKFYPELNISVTMYRGNHFNQLRQKIGIDLQSMIFTSTGSDHKLSTHPNTFLSLSYGRNFSGANQRQRWTTFGAGLLIKSQGDIFQGNTAKFYFQTDIGSSKLNLVPELYLTDNFKKSLIGIKLKYLF